MARFLLPKIHEKPKRSIPRGIKKLINFWIDFLLIWARFWKPTWNHIGHLSRPKKAQEASKTAPRRFQDGPRRFQKRPRWPKTAKDASKPAPGPSWPGFCCLQAWILMVFGHKFDPFLSRFGIIFTTKIWNRLFDFSVICANAFRFRTCFFQQARWRRRVGYF